MGAAAIMAAGSGYLASNTVAASGAGETQVPVSVAPPSSDAADLVLGPGHFTGATGKGTNFYNFGPRDGAPTGDWTQEFTVTNDGAATSNQLTLVGRSHPGFAITEDTCTGEALPPSGTCTFTIASVVTSPEETTLVLGYQDNSAPYIALTVFAVPGTADLVLSPGDLERTTDAGTNEYLTTSFHSQTFTVTNDGTAESKALGINLASMVPSSVSTFVPTISTDTCQGEPLLPGGKCTIRITGPTFPVGLTGPISVPAAMLFVNAEDGGNSYISLGLTFGPVPVPYLGLSPGQLSTITAGSTTGSTATAKYLYAGGGKWTQMFTVMNVGTVATQPISVGFLNAVGISISSDTCLGQVLALGETCTFTATATTSGFAAALVLVSTANSPLQLALLLSGPLPHIP